MENRNAQIVPMFSKSLKTNSLIYLLDEIVRIQSRFSSLFLDVRESLGLKQVESLVLSAVLEARSLPTVPQIGRSLGRPRQVIQRAVDELVELGLIEKQSNPDHKRVPLLAATKRGKALKTSADELASSVADAFLATVDAEKCQRLGDELHGLRESLEAFSRAAKESHNK